MKNWKDKVLGMFAIIGVMTLLMGNYAQQPKGVWEFHTVSHPGGSGTSSTGKSFAFSLNTVTGEVRKYDTRFIDMEGNKAGANFHLYKVTQPKP